MAATPVAGPTAGQEECQIVFCGGPDDQSEELSPPSSRHGEPVVPFFIDRGTPLRNTPSAPNAAVPSPAGRSAASGGRTPRHLGSVRRRRVPNDQPSSARRRSGLVGQV